MNYYKIGNFIGAKRREKNLTQEQLAEKLGVSNKTISKWETGKSMPDYSIIERLCDELDITIAELLDGEEHEANSKGLYDEEQVKSLLHKVQLLEDKQRMKTQSTVMINKSFKSGITFGSALAMVISYVNWHSLGWAIVHGLLSWGYVIYYLIRY